VAGRGISCSPAGTRALDVIVMHQSDSPALWIRRLGPGAYAVEGPPTVDSLAGGDGLLVDESRAAAAWIDIADVSLRPDTPVGEATTGAGNALVVVTGMRRNRWVVTERRPPGRDMPSSRSIVVTADQSAGLYVAAFAYRWIAVGLPLPELAHQPALITAPRAMPSGTA
jgi:hypothetical protein